MKAWVYEQLNAYKPAIVFQKMSRYWMEEHWVSVSCPISMM
jgi:hypothetical protein